MKTTNGSTTTTRVPNSEINERLLTQEIRLNTFGERLEDLGRTQRELGQNQKEGMDQLAKSQRAGQENTETMIRQSYKELSSAIESKNKDQGDSKKFTIQIGVMVLAITMTAMIAITGGLIGWGTFTARSYVDSFAIPLKADHGRLDSAVERNTSDVSRALTDINTLKGMSTTSEVDRRDLRSDTNKMEETLTAEVSARRAGFSALQQQLTEAERQHTMQDISRNLMHEHVMGLVKMLFEKLELPSPPSPSYFPKIGREINTPIPNE